jgi:hypothetical protein
VLTISRLTRWSIRYYNDTANTARASAMDRQAANGGLGEYYSEADSRIPTWIITGGVDAAARLCGLDGAALAGGAADTDVAGAWLDDGVAPNGQTGRAFTGKSVHGFDLTFAIRPAPSRRSLPRRSWCSRCRRRPVRARRTRSKRCGRRRTARASRSWCARRPARLSTKPCTKVPAITV